MNKPSAQRMIFLIRLMAYILEMKSKNMKYFGTDPSFLTTFAEVK